MRDPGNEVEADHLEAYNSDPTLGFFSEPIKFYFLIWNIAHCTSRYRLLFGSNGGRFVLLVVCRFSTIFSAHQENQTIVFLELLVQYQVYRLLKSQMQVSIFCIKTSLKIMLCWKYNLLHEHKRMAYHFLVVSWETRISVVIIFAWKFGTIVRF